MPRSRGVLFHVFKSTRALSLVILAVALAGAGGAQRSHAAGAGPVAAYGFNEGSGATLRDLSGNGNNGVISGASWTTGHSGGALSFNGLNSSVTVPNSASLAPSAAVTVEAWVRPSTNASWRTVALKTQNAGALSYALYSSSDTGPASMVYTSAERGAAAPSGLSTTRWSHLTAVYDGSGTRIYVNGKLIATTAARGSIAESGGALKIGGNAIWGEWFKGKIDELRIYARALSAAEVQSDMNTPVSSSTPVSPPPSSDTTPPSAPSNFHVTSSTGTSVSVAWTASTDNVAVTSYALDANGVAKGSTAATSGTVSGLVCGTAYTLGVVASDAAGNVSTRVTVSGSTSVCGDTTPPSAPTNFHVTGSTGTSVSVAWTASTDNVAVTSYALDANGVAKGSTAATSGTVSGLVCGTTYTLGIVASDAAANKSTRVTVSGSTSVCGDTTPPSVPAGLVASGVTQSSAGLSWSASVDNVGVTGYGVYSGSSLLGTALTTSFSVTGLSCGTAYTLGVDAVDGAGNRSGKASVSVTTAACPVGGGANVYVATSGSDSSCVRGDASKPCLSFGRAYQVAQCGDTVQVAGGSYRYQEIDTDSSKNCSSFVTFQPAAGQSVTVTSTGNGSSCPSQDCVALAVGRLQSANGGHWVRISGITVAGDFQGYNADHVELVNVNGGGGTVREVSNFVISGGNYGPCQSAAVSPHTTPCNSNWMFDGSNGQNSVTIQNASFHDFTFADPDHFECMFLSSGQSFLIQNNRYYNCHTYDIMIQKASSPCLCGIVIQNNWFGYTGGSGIPGPSRSSAINLESPDDALVRFNSFAAGQGIDHEANTARNSRIIGNVFGIAAGCVPGASYAYNLWTSGSCGATDRNLGGANPPFLNGSDGAAGDYHLTGATGSTLADNLVTPTTSDYTLTTDRDGNPRTAPRDAGADAR